MSQTKTYLGLDIGTVRIGVALADDAIGIAIPQETIPVNGKEIEHIARLVVDNDIETIVIGYPRNQAGEATAQSALVEAFSEKMKDLGPKLVFQDESLTSVIAEQRLDSRRKPYKKEDVDAEAAVIILEDYLEGHR